jgi:CMP-N-acetylneuraminic acid synthetase
VDNESNQHVLGIIPARGGSKGIPGKNVRLLSGQPLIAYTFEAARASRRLTRTILSTDSPEIADAGRRAGVEVPFLRPAELAGDDTPMALVIRHALDWLMREEGYQPGIVTLLQPTAPLRQAQHVDAALDMLLDSQADSVVSVTAVPGHYSPHWQFAIVDGEIRLWTGGALSEIITRRQELPPTYTRNGAIYAFWRRTFEQSGSMYGARCLAYVMPPNVSANIDSLEDWALTEYLLEERGKEL